MSTIVAHNYIKPTLMKTKNPLVALLLLLTVTSFAQENPESTYSKDIGFNTTFLFQGILNSGETPFSIMFKKYTSENKANRFGLNLYMNLNNENINQGNVNYQVNSSASVSVNVGREIQKPITIKWVWFYGGDIIPFYEFKNTKTFQNNLEFYRYESSSYGVNLRPFIALRYNINSRLYLSAESSVNLGYMRTNQLSEYQQPKSVERDTQGNNISFYVNPASGLFLYYRF